MKNIFNKLAALALCVTMGHATANTVIGTISCEQWLGAQNKLADREAYSIWLSGYMSGANAMYGEMLDRDFIKNSDKISVVDWTDAYCRKYPDSTLDDSAQALVKVLKRDMPL